MVKTKPKNTSWGFLPFLVLGINSSPYYWMPSTDIYKRRLHHSTWNKSYQSYQPNIPPATTKFEWLCISPTFLHNGLSVLSRLVLKYNFNISCSSTRPPSEQQAPSSSLPSVSPILSWPSCRTPGSSSSSSHYPCCPSSLQRWWSSLTQLWRSYHNHLWHRDICLCRGFKEQNTCAPLLGEGFTLSPKIVIYIQKKIFLRFIITKRPLF